MKIQMFFMLTLPSCQVKLSSKSVCNICFICSVLNVAVCCPVQKLFLLCSNNVFQIYIKVKCHDFLKVHEPVLVYSIMVVRMSLVSNETKK